MSTRGDLYRVARKLNNVLSHKEEQTNLASSFGKPSLSGQYVQAVCGETALYAMDCVKVIANDAYDKLPIAEYPEEGDDPEVTMYGSVLSDTYEGRSAFISVGGKASFIYLNTTLAEESKSYVDIGEKIYPLKEVEGFGKGFVSTKKCGGSHIINNSLGKSLICEKRPVDGSSDETRTILMSCFLHESSSSFEIPVADYCQLLVDKLILISNPNNPDPERKDIPYGLHADAPHALRIQADGREVEDGDIILTANHNAEWQSLWTVVEDGEWKNIGKSQFVLVKWGDIYPMTLWSLYYPKPTESVPEPISYYRIIRAGWAT